MEFQDLIEEQLNYYRAVAQEYDQWFLRRGRYDRGPEHRTEWFREIATLERALEPVIEGKEVLELACGTGLWTHRLAARSSRVLATDAAPEMLSINRERCERETWNIARPTFSRGHHRPGLTWCLFHFGCPTFQRGDSTNSGTTCVAL